MSQTKAQLLNPLGDFELTGQLVGVGATFSGNVSIAGTLTKQDVTNVDAVGLITARSGINVTGGNIFIGQGGSGANNAELKLQAGAGTGNDIIAFLNQAGTTKGNLTYDTDNNFLLFNVNASERLRIASDGNIGINKASPAVPLDVTGAVQLTGNLLVGGGQALLKADVGDSNGLKLYQGASDTSYILNHYNGPIIFGTQNAEKLRITANGSVGINSTSPSASEKLTIRGGTSDSAKFTFHSYADFLGASDAWEGYSALFRGSKASNPNSQWLGIGATTAYGWIDFANNSASKITITSTGVGLGVNNPEGLLHLFGDNNTNGPELYLTVNNNNTSDNIGALIYGNNSDKTLLKIQGLTHTANNTGDLTFHTSTAGTMGERLRIGSAGQLGIAGANYGTSGQVIISGGSGAAVAWGDAAGGAEFTGISSGSISAGNPVIVHPDGKLSKVGYSWAADLYPNPAGNSNVTQPSSSTMQDYAVAMWARQSDGTFAAGANPMVSFFYKNNSGEPQYRTSEVTNGTTNMVHKYSSGFNQGDGVGEFDIAWNPDVSNAASGGRMAAVFNRTAGGGGSYPNVQILRGPYSNGVWTQGSNTVLDSTAAQGGISIAWHDTNRWVTVYGQSGSYYGHVVTLTGSTSASVGAKSSAIETGLANMSYRGHMTDKDNNGKHIVFYAAKTTGNRNSWRYSVVTLSGTTVSFGTPNWIGNDANPGLAIGDFIPATSFDPDQNRFLVVYYKETSTNGGGAVNKIYGRNAIISGTSVTWSAETEISNSSSPQGYDTAFDTNLKKHFVYIQGASANVIYNLVNFTGSAAPSTTSNANVYSGSYEFQRLGIDYDSTYGMIVTGGRDGTDGNRLKEFITRTALSSSNLGDNNFVGFSKGSYTDGNTAKIGSLSALDENQTGLTTATTYYVKDDGTLSTTPSTPMVAAGKAVSSTNLIVKDATARPGSLGHWTYSLTGGAAFKPWCACGYTSTSGGIIGAYECANSSCRYCTGCWQPYCCNQSASEVWNYDLPTVGGGNMCLGCGGCSCDSAYNFTRACCCCWPTGRFWFPEVGIYCYNFNIILGACMGAPPSGGCWSTVSYYTVPKDRNRTCCNVFCGINGYQAYSASICGYCEPRYAFENIHMDGIVGVADTTKNFMAFGIHKASMTNCVIVQNGLTLRYDGCLGRYPNTVSFQKISNDPRITYCN